jgi:glucose/arabinose dehydrogenase
MLPRRLVVVLLSAIALLPSGLTAGADPTGGVPLGELRVTTTEAATGLLRPTAIAALNDHSGRLLITEKQGTVRVFQPDTGLAADPVLDIRDRVNSTQNERGLLGIVPAPDFRRTSLVYVAYTRLPDNALTLARIPLGDPSREQVLLTQEHAQFSNHNAGQLAFGPDRFLYWSLGDGGAAGDPFAAAQNLGTLLGKILRLDVSRSCGDLAYCIPRKNPFVGVAGAREEIWAYGLRNPWRFSFDRLDGTMWLADVGQGAWEEVNHLGKREGGLNFGWSCMEGPAVFNATRCVPDAVYTPPVFSYPNPTDGCAVIGGHVYRGHQFKHLAFGTYVATDYCSATAWAVRENHDGTHENACIGQFPTGVSSFGVDDRGELYAVTDRAGQLLRVGFERATA